ncbi:Nucleic acid-binding, OB-fold containing protein [Trema orientale]|uniref:DNA helicase n=1 Tax=Trema orientale TaxID=63057 RepID=A0A2P5EVP2_TREOI|nr:Nucleic acid-binding, OB-fold containing protein [Trema orientale]
MADLPAAVKPLAAFLVRRHSDQLRSISLSPDSKLHYPLYVDFAELMEDDPPLARLVFSQPAEYLRFFDQAAVWAHKVILGDLKGSEIGMKKEFIHVRIDICGSPLECADTFPRIGCVRVKHRGVLLTLKGTVIRSGAIKMYEGERWYSCQKCRHSFLVYPELETRNSIQLPSYCPSQEIKIQESTHVLGVGAIPRSILVVLKDDLVDIVKAGGSTFSAFQVFSFLGFTSTSLLISLVSSQ